MNNCEDKCNKTNKTKEELIAEASEILDANAIEIEWIGRCVTTSIYRGDHVNRDDREWIHVKSEYIVFKSKKPVYVGKYMQGTGHLDIKNRRDSVYNAIRHGVTIIDRRELILVLNRDLPTIHEYPNAVETFAILCKDAKDVATMSFVDYEDNYGDRDRYRTHRMYMEMVELYNDLATIGQSVIAKLAAIGAALDE